ncbi:MAG: hypothetical protein J6A03_08100 [Lachnospiraceae bacterium]|nr:hypothetical protein [Lachnospiraceae bacterium]
MKVKFSKIKLWIIVPYLFFVIVYLFSLMKYGMGNDNSRIRYYVFAIVVVLAYIPVFKKNILLKKNGIGKNLFFILIVAFVFFAVSVLKASEQGMFVPFRTYVQIALLFMPALYAFSIINILSLKDIIKLMEITLFLTIIVYFCDADHTPDKFFAIDNWKNLSFLNSFTESSLCAEVFLQLFFFFNFYKNLENKDNSRKLNFFCWLSFIFTILSFKRLAVLVACLMLLLNNIINLGGKISKKWIWIFAIIFTILTVFYFKFVNGELFSDIDVYKFTTGRDYILSLWKRYHYTSYGYGSSMLIIGRYLEMDLIQILLELNVGSLFIFCLAYFKVAQHNVYTMIVMTYIFLNMLTASSIPYSLGWIIALVSISSISSDKYVKEGYTFKMQPQRFKRLFSYKKD